MPLLDNAKIIGTFCKSKLNGILVRKPEECGTNGHWPKGSNYEFGMLN